MSQPLEKDGEKIIHFPNHYLRRGKLLSEERGTVIPLKKPFVTRFWKPMEEAFAFGSAANFVTGFSALSTLHYGVATEAAAYPLAVSLSLAGAYTLTRSLRWLTPRIKAKTQDALFSAYIAIKPTK